MRVAICDDKNIFLEQLENKLRTYSEIEQIDKYTDISELEHMFVRIHKSFFVNMDYIQRFERTVLTLKNGKTLPVSKAKYVAMKNKFFKYMGEQL